MSPIDDNDLQPSSEYRDATRDRFLHEARALYGATSNAETRRRGTRRVPLAIALGFAAAAAVVLGILFSLPEGTAPEDPGVIVQESPEKGTTPRQERPTPLPEEKPVLVTEKAVEKTPEPPAWRPPEPAGSAGERVTDDARVLADADAVWEWTEPRRIVLTSGRLYLDVEPTGQPFEVVHASGRVTVHGTRLVVNGSGDTVRVGLGSGEASLANDRGEVTLHPGEEGVADAGAKPVKKEARRFSHQAEFISDRLEDDRREAEEPSEGFVPGVAKIPNTGREVAPLEVVRYHLDVHIEDGMARTTIDQIFYNPSNARVEGTFLFPLPPDASISRLAMYVNGALMEGGMLERGRATQVYEGIVKKMLDPAILEWMEGSTFRLRIFPFEPNSERRILLSYQQPLESLYEMDRYRFPVLKPSKAWEEFSVHVLVKDAAREGWKLSFPTYPLEQVGEAGGHLEFAREEKDARPEKDLILEIRRPRRPELELATHVAGDERFICITTSPEVEGAPYRGPRRVLLVADRSGSSSMAERAAQKKIARHLLKALDRKDRICVMTYSTKPRVWEKGFSRRSKASLAGVSEFLASETFFGAGDVAEALRRASELFGDVQQGDTLLYVGDGIDTLSGLEPERIATLLSKEIRVIAIPVNRSFDRVLLSSLAERSGGRVVPISPDDRIAWRAFDLVSSLRTPEWRRLSWELLDEEGKPVAGEFHADHWSLRDGEVLRIAGKVQGAWPRTLRLQGEELPLPEPRTDRGWIPRLWAKLRIDARERESAAEHRDEITRLGKQYYVMTPYTALLVLENEAMYKQYKVERGRKDHWALYATPAEWHGKVRPSRTIYYPPNTWRGRQDGRNRFDLNVWFDYGELNGGVFQSAGTNVPGIDANVWGRFSLEVPALSHGWITPDVDGDGFGDIILNGNLAGNVDVSRYDYFFQTQDGLELTQQADRFVREFAPDIEPIRWARPRSRQSGELRTRQLFESSFGLSGIQLDQFSRILPDLSVVPVTAFPVPHREIELLQKFLPSDVDVSVSANDNCRITALTSGERLILEKLENPESTAKGLKIYLKGRVIIRQDPLFETLLRGGVSPATVWSCVPWFLLPLEVLTAGASVTERPEGDTTVVTIDRGGLKVTEILFSRNRPVELRVVLGGDQVLHRVVYDDWQDVDGRLLPRHGTVFGIRGTILDTMTYRYDVPGDADRAEVARLRDGMGSDAAWYTSAFGPALASYRFGSREALEAHLRRFDKEGLAGDDLRKLARLAAIRWGTDAVIEAPPLDPQALEVKRWLPREPLPRELMLEQALERGDLTTLYANTFLTKTPEKGLKLLGGLRKKCPESLHGLLDLWTGELALRKGWNLKAYEAFERASAWKPLSGSISLQDRLGHLALGRNEPEKALEHCERALELLLARKLSAPPTARFAHLADVAKRGSDLWARRGKEILERWANATPRNPEPYLRLAELHRGAGELELAVRYASHPAELTRSTQAYEELAKELDGMGESERAAACRKLARLEK